MGLWRFLAFWSLALILGTTAAHAEPYLHDSGWQPRHELFALRKHLLVRTLRRCMYQGNSYVVSCDRIYKVTPQGQWTVVAGTGEVGYSGDGGPATSAKLALVGVLAGAFVGMQSSPVPAIVGLLGGAFLDGSGNIYIADCGNNRVREVSAATGIIQTVAGNGSSILSLPGSPSNGDGGPATGASILLALAAYSWITQRWIFL